MNVCVLSVSVCVSVCFPQLSRLWHSVFLSLRDGAGCDFINVQASVTIIELTPITTNPPLYLWNKELAETPKRNARTCPMMESSAICFSMVGQLSSRQTTMMSLESGGFNGGPVVSQSWDPLGNLQLPYCQIGCYTLKCVFTKTCLSRPPGVWTIVNVFQGPLVFLQNMSLKAAWCFYNTFL